MYKTLAIGQEFLQSARIGTSGHVHSIFKRAINIRTAKGEIRTILTQDGDIMDAAIVINAEELLETAKIGDTVLLTSENVYIDNMPLIYGLRQVKPWSADFAAKRFSDSQILDRCLKVEKLLVDQEGYDAYYLAQKAKKDSLIHLLGLGIGLTPAGDDFNCGLLVVLAYLEKIYGRSYLPLPEIRSSILSNLYRTNEISGHFLKHALNSQMGKATSELLFALFSLEDEHLFEAVQKKMTYGATSGMDEICGMIYGIRLFMENKEQG